MPAYDKLSAAEKECINYHIYALFADSQKRVTTSPDDVEAIDMARMVTRLAVEHGDKLTDNDILASLVTIDIVEQREAITTNANKLGELRAAYNRALPALREGLPGGFTPDFFTKKIDAYAAFSGAEYTPD